MLDIHIPGRDPLCLEHLLLDYNGTLAEDGRPIPGTCQRIQRISRDLTVHVITADTFGTVEAQLADTPCRIVRIPEPDQIPAKADYLEKLGASRTLACGNGANDEAMLKVAAMGVAVLQAEGMAPALVMAADILITDIHHLFDLLEKPNRMVATLRR